jgi:hypothetical protein
MTCAGVCTLCGYNRNSRLCTCLERVRNHDPFHPLLANIEISIRENRYFGKKAFEQALEEIQAARCAFMSDYAGDNRRHSDGWDIKRIDEQAKRLVLIAKGKLFGTAQRMRERGDTKPANSDDVAVTRARLDAILGAQP